MNKLFGTDGIRGIACKSLSCSLAFKVGAAAASVIAGKVKTPDESIKYKKAAPHPEILIGTDTRRSGDCLAASIAAGICSAGCNARMLGVVPTPAVAYLVLDSEAAAGVMVSASHNPSEYNGIKIFGPDGYKLSDETEDIIEDMILRDVIPLLENPYEIGRISDGKKLIENYIAHIAKYIRRKTDGDRPFKPVKILIDLSNGSACSTAKQIFISGNGIEYDFINDSPDGDNINLKCGSTDTNILSKKVRCGNYAMGIAFDGDADRCLLVDEKGMLIDGDQMLAQFALDHKPENLTGSASIRANRAVVTVMSNIGLLKYFEANKIPYDTTGVGDRYVLQRMTETGADIGGEQSGHIIFSDAATTGDGQLTASRALSLLFKSEKSAASLFSGMQKFPQILQNIKANDYEKALISSNPEFKSLIKKFEKEMGSNGRILVRSSGTEPLMRIMAEGKDESAINSYVNLLCEMAQNIIKDSEGAE